MPWRSPHPFECRLPRPLQTSNAANSSSENRHGGRSRRLLRNGKCALRFCFAAAAHRTKTGETGAKQRERRGFGNARWCGKETARQRADGAVDGFGLGQEQRAIRIETNEIAT